MSLQSAPSFDFVNLRDVNTLSFNEAHMIAKAIVSHRDFADALEWATANDERDYEWAESMLIQLNEREITHLTEWFVAKRVLPALRCAQTVLARFQKARVQESFHQQRVASAELMGASVQPHRSAQQLKKAEARRAAKMRRAEHKDHRLSAKEARQKSKKH